MQVEMLQIMVQVAAVPVVLVVQELMLLDMVVLVYNFLQRLEIQHQ
jgi:hypothetical protein